MRTITALLAAALGARKRASACFGGRVSGVFGQRDASEPWGAGFWVAAPFALRARRRYRGWRRLLSSVSAARVVAADGFRLGPRVRKERAR